MDPVKSLRDNRALEGHSTSSFGKCTITFKPYKLHK